MPPKQCRARGGEQAGRPCQRTRRLSLVSAKSQRLARLGSAGSVGVNAARQQILFGLRGGVERACPTGYRPQPWRVSGMEWTLWREQVTRAICRPWVGKAPQLPYETAIASCRDLPSLPYRFLKAAINLKVHEIDLENPTGTGTRMKCGDCIWQERWLPDHGLIFIHISLCFNS